MLTKLIVAVIISAAIAVPFKLKETPKCGYSSCHAVNPDKITVHLIPHSHNDLGWLKTVDQSFYGSNNQHQLAGVQYIIDSYVESLKLNPNRRFIQVETGYLYKWWRVQTEEKRQEYRDLINSGQLEIINGGWSMNDEADTNYQSIIDQFTWGLRFLNESLGECGAPKVGWQIDPFGHSREMASLYHQLAFDGFLSARIDYRDKDQRKRDKNMDFIWKGSDVLDGNEIFSSILEDFYDAPNNFCFDVNCGNKINDDVTSPDYNLDKKVEEFSKYIKDRIGHYQTSNILIAMGGDFQYMAAETNFINLDKLIKAFKDDKEIELIYSTPSCYLKSVNEEAQRKSISLRVKTDDFFPYAMDAHGFWGGFLTSRPTTKRFERMGNNILQSVKQLAAYAKMHNLDYGEKDIDNLRETMGVLQHHDAITGTEKQHVFLDYTRLLTRALRRVETNVHKVVKDILKSDDDIKLTTCLLGNVTVCESSQWDKFIAVVYNPLGQTFNSNVRIPVSKGQYSVTGPEGPVNSIVIDSMRDFSYVQEHVPATGKELLIQCNNLPPMGLNLYYVEKINTDKSPESEKPNKAAKKFKFGTDATSFEIDESTNLLKSVTMNSVTIEIGQQFYYYDSANGKNDNVDRASGFYLFRPVANSTGRVFAEKPKLTVLQQNDIVDEIRQDFGESVTQTIRVYKNDDAYIEFDWVVGPLEVNNEDRVGKEVVTRFLLPDDFVTDGKFLTDSNGRQTIERKINYRAEYSYDATEEPIAGNYYPVTSKIAVKDETKNIQVGLLNDRAQGGAHLQLDGMNFIELMVHRRVLMPDFGEALNETEYERPLVVRGQHYLVISSTEDATGNPSSVLERALAIKKALQPVVLVGDAKDVSLENLNKNFSILKREVANNVHILTLEPWEKDSYLLRLENIDENANAAQSVEVNLTDLIPDLTIRSVRETTLGANKWLDKFSRPFEWNSNNNGKTSGSRNNNFKLSGDDFVVTLGPMEIKTFIINSKDVYSAEPVVTSYWNSFFNTVLKYF